MNELIRVTQLPIIEERLRSLKENIENTVSNATALVCTEDTVKTVKAARADLRKLYDELEAQRKAVKAAVMGPYEAFEKVYRECVSEPMKRGDADLKRKIDDVESDIKGRCEAELRDYFGELCEAHHLDWLTYERAGVKVDMASAKQKTPKKLREQIASFVASVSCDMDTISGLENADEILSEYKKCLSFSEAFGTVSDRHRRIEEEAKFRAERERIRAAEQEAVRKVEALAPPTIQPEKLTITFTVTDTRERLIALREWMKANGYQYK